MGNSWISLHASTKLITLVSQNKTSSLWDLFLIYFWPRSMKSWITQLNIWFFRLGQNCLNCVAVQYYTLYSLLRNRAWNRVISFQGIECKQTKYIKASSENRVLWHFPWNWSLLFSGALPIIVGSNILCCSGYMWYIYKNTCSEMGFKPLSHKAIFCFTVFW